MSLFSRSLADCTVYNRRIATREHQSIRIELLLSMYGMNAGSSNTVHRGKREAVIESTGAADSSSDLTQTSVVAGILLLGGGQLSRCCRLLCVGQPGRK